MTVDSPSIGTAPRHVAIISDGSARWATANSRSLAEGHEAAADNVLARIGDGLELGLKQLTFFAFSTENWARPPEEVRALVRMLAARIARDTPRLHEQGVCVRFIGRRDRAGGELVAQMRDSEHLTAENNRLGVYIAFDYGGRDEIVSAAARFTGGGEREFAELMRPGEMRDPDLVIRTGGEQRLSNFLLWQAAYSELVFRPELWPDFGRRELEESLNEYSRRDRRFGARERSPIAAV